MKDVLELVVKKLDAEYDAPFKIGETVTVTFINPPMERVQDYYRRRRFETDFRAALNRDGAQD